MTKVNILKLSPDSRYLQKLALKTANFGAKVSKDRFLGKVFLNIEKGKKNVRS